MADLIDTSKFCSVCGGQVDGKYRHGRICKCESNQNLDHDLEISKQKEYSSQPQRNYKPSLRELFSMPTPEPKPKRDRPKLFGNEPRIS